MLSTVSRLQTGFHFGSEVSSLGLCALARMESHPGSKEPCIHKKEGGTRWRSGQKKNL